MPLEQQAPAEHAPLRPLTKPRQKKLPKPKPDQCLNCGAAATGKFCAECGQENEDQTVAVKLLVGDLLSDLASFDSKLLRTLVPLVIRPGFLTNEYNAGRRVRYLSPFKLYLTASIVFFLALPLTHQDNLLHLDSADPAKAEVTLKTAQQTAGARLKTANTQLKTNADFQESQADLQDSLQEAAPGLTLPPVPKDSAPRHAVQSRVNFSFGHSTYDLTHLPQTVAAYDAEQRDPRRRPDPKPVQYVKRQVIKVKQNPQSLSAALLNDIPKMMFVLLPAFALSLKLVYLRSRRFYIEHLIFSLHLHAFLFLLLTLLLAMQVAAPHAAAIAPVAVAAALVYPYIAMRVVYKQGWGKTFVKYSLLSFNYVFLLTFTFVGALLVAFLIL